MRLAPGGLDVFYIDESADRDVFAMSSVSIPFIRPVENDWHIVWSEAFESVRDWRRSIKQTHRIPMKKELHGVKLASGRGRYRNGNQQFSQASAVSVYREILSNLGFLQDASIISVVGTRQSNLYGQRKLQAILFALLQRMRTACERNRRNGIVFFDEGHGEYRKLYRRSMVYLPTGSRKGDWGDGAMTRNMPLDNFTKDANFKDSQHSFFVQVADLVAYALFLKVKGEIGTLTPWQNSLSAGELYNSIPRRVLNTRASNSDPLGVVRL